MESQSTEFEELITWLNNKFPNGIDHEWDDEVDIREQLMFCSGGGPADARTTASAHQRYVLADLFMERLPSSDCWYSSSIEE